MSAIIATKKYHSTTTCNSKKDADSTSIAMAVQTRWQRPRGRRKRPSSCRHTNNCTLLMMVGQFFLIGMCSMMLHSLVLLQSDKPISNYHHPLGGRRNGMMMMMGGVVAEAFSTPLTFDKCARATHQGISCRSGGRHYYQQNHQQRMMCPTTLSSSPSSSPSLSCFNSYRATSSRTTFLSSSNTNDHHHHDNTITSRKYSAATTRIATDTSNTRIRSGLKSSTSTSLSLAIKATTTTTNEDAAETSLKMDKFDSNIVSSNDASSSVTASSSSSSSFANSNNNDNNSNNNNSAKNMNNNAANSNNSNNNNIHQNSWLDRTTARLLDTPSPLLQNHQQHHYTTTNEETISTNNSNNNSNNNNTMAPLTPDDVNLITTLMTSHARRATIESARICEQLLKRVVEEVNRGNEDVRVTTKMYTVAMDAWAKSQRRPLPGSGAITNTNNPSSSSSSNTNNNIIKNEDNHQEEDNRLSSPPKSNHHHHQKQLQLHPQQQLTTTQRLTQQTLPLGAAAQRAHRIHTSLVKIYQSTHDVHLAPSTISYNAAINAWSKSYHPSAGEMAELLLGEMMREWRFGTMGGGDVGMEEEEEEEEEEEVEEVEEVEGSKRKRKRGNERVKPDVVTFTAVIDAWVKCTALAHDYHYEQPPDGANNTTMRQEREDYVEWKRSQAEKADALTRRAATRAKQLLNLMIQLGHYDPERHNVTSTSNDDEDDDGEDRELSLFNVDRCEPGMRPNCYTYSAVMNALAKSCSALRVMASNGNNSKMNNNQNKYRDRGNKRREPPYDPAREAQDMLESMIEKHERYKERVGETDIWKNSGYARTSPHDDDWMLEDADDEEIGYDDDYIGSNSSYQKWMKETSPSSTADGEANSHWFEPRPDELTFPPNTINYNSVLNAWSRASRYDPYSAIRAEKILLERMERPLSEGGDAVEPDALSYSLVIHAWLRGCRGNTGHGPPPSSYRPRKRNFTDEERIYKAIEIVDRLEAWAREAHAHRMVGNGRSDSNQNSHGDYLEEDDDDDDYSEDDLVDTKQSFSRSSSYTFRQHNKARDLDVEVYNSILVAFSREQGGDHAASVMKLLDRMERIADELDMPSVRPNQRSYNVALDVIAKSAMIANTSLAGYYYKDKKETISKKRPGHHFNPLYAGRAAESILSRMLARDFRPDAYTFASVLNTYQRIPNGKLDAALAADAVVRGMESLHLHGKIDQPPDVFHYTMVCACWSRSGEQGVAGERCSEILRHMQQRDKAGFPRVRPNIRTFNAVIDSHAYNGRVAEAEDMLLSMVDNYESSAARSMDGIEDEELPVRPDSFSFNTVIQQWARTRTPEGGRRAEIILDRMLKFHYAGNADVRPDERSFSYIIYHYTKGAGRMAPDAPDRALKLLRKMIEMYRQGYTELMPSHQNRTNPIFAFTSVIDAHSVLRRNDSGLVGAELLESMTKLGEKLESLRPNTYACLSVLYGWSSCGSIDAGERATELLRKMEADMKDAASRGEESIMRTTQRCYILAQTAWARSQSENKATGALEVLHMMEQNYAEQNLEARPTVQAYSMVLNACAFADSVEVDGKIVKASPKQQMKAFQIAEVIMSRLSKEPYPNVKSTSMTYGTFIKCCGRLDLPNNIAQESASRAFADCCRTGYVSDFVFTQLRYALPPEKFLNVLAQNGYKNLNSKGKSLSRDGKRIRPVRLDDLPDEWKRCVDRNANRSNR